jgi:hypothetical protein
VLIKRVVPAGSPTRFPRHMGGSQDINVGDKVGWNWGRGHAEGEVDLPLSWCRCIALENTSLTCYLLLR